MAKYSFTQDEEMWLFDHLNYEIRSNLEDIEYVSLTQGNEEDCQMAILDLSICKSIIKKLKKGIYT